MGRSFHLKICDFGSDNPVYARDYYAVRSPAAAASNNASEDDDEDEDGASLLIPIRWMAAESVVMVSSTPITQIST